MTGTNWVGVTPDPPARVETCQTAGHDLEQVVTGYGQLIRVDCLRCSRSWGCEET